LTAFAFSVQALRRIYAAFSWLIVFFFAFISPIFPTAAGELGKVVCISPNATLHENENSSVNRKQNKSYDIEDKRLFYALKCARNVISGSVKPFIFFLN